MESVYGVEIPGRLFVWGRVEACTAAHTCIYEYMMHGTKRLPIQMDHCMSDDAAKLITTS
jgi:hypothetical protein